MAATVLASIDAWFETEIFAPLRQPPDPERAVSVMFEPATALAQETVADIPGAIVLARALDDPGIFTRTIASLRRRLESPARS